LKVSRFFFFFDERGDRDRGGPGVSDLEAVFVNLREVVVAGIGRAHKLGHEVSVVRGLWDKCCGCGVAGQGRRDWGAGYRPSAHSLPRMTLLSGNSEKIWGKSI